MLIISCNCLGVCILLLVTALPAVDFTDVQAVSVRSTFTGWKTYGGKKYYYKNGKKLTDLHKIGKYYYCFAADGTMLTGWHRIHNRFRYFGKQTGRMRINQTVNGRKINSKGVWTPVVVLDPGHSAVVAGGYEPLGPGSQTYSFLHPVADTYALSTASERTLFFLYIDEI